MRWCHAPFCLALAASSACSTSEPGGGNPASTEPPTDPVAVGPDGLPIDGPPGATTSPTATEPGVGVDPIPPGDPLGPAPGPIPVRRLTNAEYLTSVADLFPASAFAGGAMPVLEFVPDTRVANLRNISSAQTSTRVRMEQYETAAQTLADSLVADPSALTGCDVATLGEQACAEPFLFDLGKRAFRRPLEERERAILSSLLLDSAAVNDYPTRLSLAIRYLLLSPNFLFRPEVGVAQPGSSVLTLTPHEVATRLSYFLTGTAPDAQLTAAADSGELNGAEAVRTHALRLLAEPRAQANLTAFHQAWLNTESVASDRDETLFPTFTPGIALFMAEESRLFFQNVLFTQGGSLRELYTAPYTFANATLAQFYGAAPAAADWQRVELDPSQRAGLLTQPAWLINNGHIDEGSAILRGKFVLENFLCSSVPNPTQGIIDQFPVRDRSLTMREWLTSQHEENPVCNTCHGILDPLGLPFEHYDGVGLWRPDDRGMALDVSGSYTTGTDSIAFNGAVELAQLLPDFAPAKGCYVSWWFRFGLGRLDNPADANDRAYLDWLASGYPADAPVVDLVGRFIESNAFRVIRLANNP